MRQKIAIGILLVFCFSEVRPIFPFLEYCLNYEYISKVLCINKDKPESSCNGKCYLSEQLEKSQKSEKKEKKIPMPTAGEERSPMIMYSYEFADFAKRNLIIQKHSVFYHFSVKDFVVTPPTPPPKC